MARKERNLASFGDMASENSVVENNEIKNAIVNKNKNVVRDNNDIIVNNDNKNEDVFDRLLEGKKKKQPKKVWTGVYLKPDIAQVLEILSKKGGKGAKSEIVNESLRRVFTEKGLM